MQAIVDQSVPFLGMKSSIDPLELTPGILSLAQNVRADGLTPKTRQGSSAIVASPISGATFKGAASFAVNGSNLLLAAFRVSSATRVYKLSGSSWSELTDAGTRFSTDGDVGFAVVRDVGVTGVTSASDVLVAGVSGDDPRVILDAQTGFPSRYKHIGQLVPTAFYATPAPYGWFTTMASATASASGANFVSTAASTGPTLEVKTGVTVGDTAEVLFQLSREVSAANAANTGLTLGPEVVLSAYDQGSGKSLWDYTNKLELLVIPTSATTGTVSTTAAAASAITVTTSSAHGLSTGDYVRITGVTGFAGSMGSFKITVASPTTFTLNGTSTTGSGTGGTWTKLEWVTLYDSTTVGTVAGIQTQVVGTDTLNVLYAPTNTYVKRTGWSGIRLTANGSAPAANFTNTLFTVATTGYLDGRTLWRGSLYSSTSKSEGVALQASVTQATCQQYGASTNPAASNFQWAPGSEHRTSWSLTIQGYTGQTGSPDYGLFYRSDPFEDAYGNPQWGPYYLSGTQGHVTLTASSSVPWNTGTVTLADVDTTRLALDVGALPIPKGNLFAYVNDRLFVAGLATDRSSLWVSGQSNPFTFRQIPIDDGNGNLDPTSPTSRTFSGENVVKLQFLQGDLFGVDSTLVFTNYALYRLSGYTPEQVVQAARIGDKGCLRGATVATYDNSVWFLDTEKQARRTNAGLASEQMSRAKVDSYLYAGTLTNAFAVATFGTFRLFFQESGASDIRVALVWQEITGEWVLDRYPWALKGAIVHDTGSGRVLYVIKETGEMYQLDVYSATDDAGTAIPVVLQSKEYMTSVENTQTFGQMVLMTDGAINTTFTTERYCPYDGSTTTGVLNATTGSLGANPAYRKDLTSGGGVPGSQPNPSGIMKIYADMPAGKRIRTWRVNIMARSSGPDVA